MCGRYSLTTPLEAVRQIFDFAGEANLAPRYNIAPTQTAPVIRAGDDGGRVLALARWGLIPSWAKEAAIGNRMINARAETVAEKPSFRSAYRHRRCVVPADGFYEWQKQPKGAKQPYRIC
ncbi:MAG: SOS response-associated peptidase, partial [Alphaproteobacteria bacterium]|nr:SOS response-associated peptidase [Alphaproteobacteria bacterium]